MDLQFCTFSITTLHLFYQGVNLNKSPAHPPIIIDFWQGSISNKLLQWNISFASIKNSECKKFHLDSIFLTLMCIFSFSFQSDFSLGDKTALVKSVSDSDAKLLAVLPKGVHWFKTHAITQNKTNSFLLLTLLLILIFFCSNIQFQSWKNTLRELSQRIWEWTGISRAHYTVFSQKHI